MTNAWLQGYNEYDYGCEIFDNPYEDGLDEFDDWNRGWLNACEDEIDRLNHQSTNF